MYAATKAFVTETNFFERADLMDTAVGQAEKDDAAKVAKQASTR